MLPAHLFVETPAEVVNAKRLSPDVAPVLAVSATSANLPSAAELPEMPLPVGPWPFPTGPRLPNAAKNRKYVPPVNGITPGDLFQPRLTMWGARFVHHIPSPFKNSNLIYTDGSSPENGASSARAGYGVVYGPGGCMFSAPLEKSEHAPTSNRAELRAVIAALTFRFWPGETFSNVVIACDSEYVVLGICERVEGWKANGWRTRSKSPVKNKDLWLKLVDAVEHIEGAGISVQFWRIPRALNTVADRLAKEAAVSGSFCSIRIFRVAEIRLMQNVAEIPDRFTPVFGTMAVPTSEL